MPRHARVILTNFPHHVVQRGHNRQVVFANDDDFRYYLSNLKEWKIELGCKIYAYCLMSNHIHLVVDPGEQPENLSRLMKRVAGKQTRLVNRLKRRSGTLWEGRFKSSPIQTDQYLLACCRYVELNPLRAGLVNDPSTYPWSSCAARSGRAEQAWLDADPCYLNLGATPDERVQKYRKWLLEPVQTKENVLIREAVQRGGLTATRRYEKELSEKTGISFNLRKPGRPKKLKNKSVPFL